MHTYHYWDALEKPLPIAIYSKRLNKKIDNKDIRFKTSLWLLNYGFNEGSHYRVGSTGASWHVRKAYEAHLYPPGTTVWEKLAASITRVDSVFIMFKDESTYLRELIHDDEFFAKFSDPDRLLEGHLKDIAETASHLKEKGFWEVQSIFFKILSYLRNSKKLSGSTYEIQTPNFKMSKSDFVSEVNQFLYDNLYKNVKREDLARHMNISVSQLSHRFKEETGVSVKKRLNNLRISLAKELILRGEPLKSIADQTGFTDSFHLSKAFKKHEGISPRFYKNKFLSS